MAEAQDEALNAVDYAEQLIDERKKADFAQQQAFNTLPLFRPGKLYSAKEAQHGFRILDGCALSFNASGEVKVGKSRNEKATLEKTLTIMPHTADGSLAWVYWNFELDLHNAMINYGMGGWVDSKRDIRAKVIYLNAERSNKPSKCFFLAMDRPSDQSRILVKGSENDPKVMRIYQSAIPDELKPLIALRDLINVRDGGNIPGFWEM